MMSRPVPCLVLLTIASVVGCGDGGGPAPVIPSPSSRGSGAGALDAAAPDGASGSVAPSYASAGPWTVSTCDVAAASASCVAATAASDASAGPLYVVFYPTSPGATRVQHPVITWGNGTGAAPGQYSVLLTHLASWGFVVIASTSTDHVGAVGHSQGADGAAQALLAADAPGSTHRFITTLVPIELPAQEWTCIGSSDPGCAAAESFDAKNLVHGSVFFVDGSKDTLIAPPTQTAGTSGEQSIEAYYAATPTGTPRAKGTLIGADHNDIQDHCTVGVGCAGVGPKGYLGYVTAWLMYQLAGDARARSAFAGTAPEIDGDPTWENAEQASLP
jgi:hypothetical protein